MVTSRARQRMATLVRQWETSGEPRRAFASRHGLTVAQFDCWKRQVRRGGAAGAASMGFARVQVVDTPRQGHNGGIEVLLGGGDRLTIHEGTSVDLVRAVVMTLRASC